MPSQVRYDVARQLSGGMVREQAAAWGGVEGREASGGQEISLHGGDGVCEQVSPSDGVGREGGECQ